MGDAGSGGLCGATALKRSPELSHTEGRIGISRAILEKNGVAVEVLRPVGYDIAFGVGPDMKEHGWKSDDWPEILEKVMASDMLVPGSAIRLGEAGPGLPLRRPEPRAPRARKREL